MSETHRPDGTALDVPTHVLAYIAELEARVLELETRVRELETLPRISPHPPRPTSETLAASRLAELYEIVSREPPRP